jgi:hypothetical protein
MASSYKNFAYSTVATAPSPASSGTSLIVSAADGAKFPAAPFMVTIWPSGTQPTTTNAEIAEVTQVSTDTLTITRAQEGTAARTVVVGDQIAAAVTAAVLDTPQTNTVPTEDAWLLPNYSAVALEEYVLDATHELIFGDPSEMAVV